MWDDAASSNGSAAPSTTRSTPSSPVAAAHSSRHALLKSSARFLQEVQSQWPAVPTIDIDRPSIHTLGVPGSDRRLAKARSGSSASSHRSHSSKLAPKDALPTPRAPPTRSVSSTQLTSSFLQTKTVPDKVKQKDKNRLSVASSFIHRDSEALEELLLEHENVAHGVRQRSSHESLNRSYAAGAIQTTEGDSAANGVSPATQVPTYEAEGIPQGEPGASAAFSHANGSHTASPARVLTSEKPFRIRRASLRKSLASAPPRNGGTPLSPICSVHNAASPSDLGAPRSWDAPVVPLIPAVLAAELPSQADLTAAPPLERFAVIAALFSTMVKGSQTSVQQLGNKTVRLKGELRARLEEMKRHESKR